MHISCFVFAALCGGLFLSSHILRICQWVLWFKHMFSRCDGRRRTFSFSRKICKLALALVSGTWSKVFQFTQFTMGCECQSKLQICSSERNVPLLPVDWKTISKRMMSANPVCGTNIKAPELAVKGTPQKELRIP